MRANELCQLTAHRLHEVKVGCFIPCGSRNVLFVRTPTPCFIVCRVRLNAEALEYDSLGIPVLLVRNETEIELAALLLSYPEADERSLRLTSLAMWRSWPRC